MTRIMGALFAISIACSTSAALALEEIEAPDSRFIVGNGFELIQFSGEPDEDGLLFEVQEPDRCLTDPWVVLAYNDSDEPINDLRVRIEKQIDGEWYLANMDADVILAPKEIGPGEWAWAEAGNMGCAEDDWDDVRVVRDLEETRWSGRVVDLTLEDVEIDRRGNISGTIENQSEFDVTDIQVNILCMDEDGWFTDAYTVFVNLRRLRAGDATEEDLTTGNGECESQHIFLTAMGVKRD